MKQGTAGRESNIDLRLPHLAPLVSQAAGSEGDASSLAPMPTLGNELARARRSCGLTQQAVAIRLSRAQSLVSRWETGVRAITPLDLAGLVAELQLDLDGLLRVALPRDRRRRSSRRRSPRARERLGEALASRREALGLEPVTIAAVLEISPYRLWRIEGGTDMTMYEFAGLCRVLGLRPSLVMAAFSEPLSRPGGTRLTAPSIPERSGGAGLAAD